MPDLLERLRSALSDRYAVESEIGRGGMAVVFLAEDLKHHRQVALKVLHSELTATLGADRFLHEIEILAGLNHPHILPLHDSGEADGLLFYVMPYAEGESLRQRLDREKQLAVDESVRIAVEVADGLDYAHRRGVVHRDIKPGNILLAEGHAVIADFGIARAIEAAKADRVTSTGLGVGTPLYASPEQATAQETLDGRTDIYSLGCVLYEMLAGEPPLTGSTPQMIQARRLAETPTALNTVRDTVPPVLDQVIARALARIPADRFATASQFGQALQAAILVATPAAHLDITPVVRQRTQGKRSVRRLVVPFGLAALLAIAAATVLLSGGWRRGTEQIRVSNIVQVTNEPGAEIQPALSPNGYEVAYAAISLDSGGIIVRSTVNVGSGGQSHATRVRTPWDLEPSWTPDGVSLRFYGHRPESDSGWKLVGQRGGTVLPLPHPTESPAAWSPDGELVAYAVGDSLLVSSAAGDSARLLAIHPDDTPGLHSMSWSPDGRWIAYVDGNVHWLIFATVGSASLWLVPAEGGEPIRVTTDRYNDQSPEWLPDGRTLLFVSDRDGAMGIHAIDIGPDGQSTRPRAILSSSDAQSISVSKDGKRLVYAKRPAVSSIWSYPTSGASQQLSSAGVTVTTGDQSIAYSSVSPDGKWIAFDSDRLGEAHIYKQRLNGGPQLLIGDIDGHAFAPAWSSSGGEIAFASDDGVFVVSSDGGTPVQVADHYGPLPGLSGEPSWSPDDLTIAFASNGRVWHAPTTIWTVTRDSVGAPWGSPRMLTDFNCAWPDWHPRDGTLVCRKDKNEVLRLSRDGEVIWRYDPSLHGLRRYVDLPEFSWDGSRIYFIAIDHSGEWWLWWIPSTGGAPTKMIALENPAMMLWGVTAGPEAVYLTFIEFDGDIWVMDLDW